MTAPCSASAYTVIGLTLEDYSRCWRDKTTALGWDCLFMLPPWINLWLKHFGSGEEPQLYAVRHHDEIIGIAPLLIRGREARLIGSADVCDYLDFVVAPGHEGPFFAALAGYLKKQGVSLLTAAPLRPDSTMLKHLQGMAERRVCGVVCEKEDVSYELLLPASWDAYLKKLDDKQRHEIRRKLRRLQEAGAVTYRTLEDPVSVMGSFDQFLALFRSSRQDKEAFMTESMEAFFKSLAGSLAACGIMKLSFMDIDNQPAAAVMCFDYHDTMYLYNNGYDRRFRAVNAGLLCKVLNIKDSIARGLQKYDFLKGDEQYKHRLGGTKVQLFRCRVML